MPKLLSLSLPFCGTYASSRYIIQDNSKNLSGGEKSRIALARAVYKPTPVILLDEIYASLDNAAIPEIERALQELAI